MQTEGCYKAWKKGSVWLTVCSLSACMHIGYYLVQAGEAWLGAKNKAILVEKGISSIKVRVVANKPAAGACMHSLMQENAQT